jgi:hypothetical protein
MDELLMKGLWDARQPLPTSGVYLLWNGSQLEYVGQGGHGPLRVGEHIRDRDPKYTGYKGWSFDAFTFVPCEKSEMNELELSYIRLLNPRYNKRR